MIEPERGTLYGGVDSHSADPSLDLPTAHYLHQYQRNANYQHHKSADTQTKLNPQPTTHNTRSAKSKYFQGLGLVVSERITTSVQGCQLSINSRSLNSSAILRDPVSCPVVPHHCPLPTAPHRHRPSPPSILPSIHPHPHPPPALRRVDLAAEIETRPARIKVFSVSHHYSPLTTHIAKPSLLFSFLSLPPFFFFFFNSALC